jgi:glycine cleavage system aminomethyltransferase T
MTAAEWDKVRLGQYESLTRGVAWVDMGPRTELEITGRDRIRVVNNFCTADIRTLEVGQGAEALIPA